MIIDKDTLILVYYISMDACEGMEERIKLLDEVRNKVMNEGCYTIVLPIFEENSRVDCLNPKYMSPDEYKNIEEKIKEVDIGLKKFLSNIENKTKY